MELSSESSGFADWAEFD